MSQGEEMTKTLAAADKHLGPGDDRSSSSAFVFRTQILKMFRLASFWDNTARRQGLISAQYPPNSAPMKIYCFLLDLISAPVPKVEPYIIYTYWSHLRYEYFHMTCSMHHKCKKLVQSKGKEDCKSKNHKSGPHTKSRCHVHINDQTLVKLWYELIME